MSRALETGACGCMGMCDWRGGCELAAQAGKRHKQTLIDMALERSHDALQMRDFCMQQARVWHGVESGKHCAWLRMARKQNQRAMRARRTARQAAAQPLPDYNKPTQPQLVGHDFVKGDALRQERRTLRRLILMVLASWLMMAVAVFGVGFVIGYFNPAQAGTLDLEISVGANVTEHLSGSGRFNNGVSYDGGFAGPKDTIEFALVWRSDSGKWFVKLSHISHLTAGPPFNSRPEDFLERLEFGYRWRLRGGR
jgi:hypothetical protein